MRLDGHVYAEHRADGASVAGHREDDSVGAHFAEICRDSCSGAPCAQHSLHFTLLDDVYAERCARAGISPGDCVMTYRAAASLQQAADDGKPTRQTDVDLGR